MWTVILNDLRALLAKVESLAQAAENEFITIWSAAFPAAEQAAIQALLPLGTTIITDLQSSGTLTSKQIASEALAQMETALVAAGKDFVMTFAMQAISTVMAQQVGNVSASTISNGGNVTNNAAS
jgi:hypothetical protein